jgi:hypothetical protein
MAHADAVGRRRLRQRHLEYSRADAEQREHSEVVRRPGERADVFRVGLVRVTNTATRKVRYLPTSHHSTMGVATGTTPVSTNVTVPGNMSAGQYSLVVVANGIASDPVTVKVSP